MIREIWDMPLERSMLFYLKIEFINILMMKYNTCKKKLNKHMHG